MKSKDLIKKLQELDPEGETEVCINSTSDIFDIELLPAYYDGKLNVLKRDENNRIIGLEIKILGSKISLAEYDLRDYILHRRLNLDNLNITFDVDPPNDYTLSVIEKYKQEAEELNKRLSRKKER